MPMLRSWRSGRLCATTANLSPGWFAIVAAIVLTPRPGAVALVAAGYVDLRAGRTVVGSFWPPGGSGLGRAAEPPGGEA